MTISLSGVYTWTYPGGEFIVHLRPNGVFFSFDYPADATWTVTDDTVDINWDNYGKYQLLKFSPGCYHNLTKGRKLEFLRPFTETELLLMGDGGGSVWSFEHARGSFEVEFRVDGFNHFICPAFPAHSHWYLDDHANIVIDWGVYGFYELTLDARNRIMDGHKAGEPSSWRRARWLKPLGRETLSTIPPRPAASASNQ